jgi:pimeloyl-ACP methyl ester carboxylesterase
MADTILMVHGMWGGAWYWEKFRGFFEEKGYRCVAVTLPYHDTDPKGIPDPRLGMTGLLDYAGFLEKEIEKLGTKPVIIGHSMGGLLAQILSARSLAKSIVLLTPASPSGIIALTPSVIKSFWSVMSKWNFWNKPMRQTFGEATYSMLNLLPEKEQKETYGRFVYESGRAAFEIGYWLLDSKNASKVDASRVTCPVLVIAGSKDNITPASVVRKVAEKYKGATYKEFGNHAHWIMAEPGSEEVAKYIVGWLTQHQLG